MGRTQLLILAVPSIAGIWSLVAETDAPIRTIPLTFAFIVLTGFGLVRKSQPWTLLGLFFGALAVNVSTRTVFDFGASHEVVVQLSFVASVFFGTIGLLITARPHLSDPALRAKVRIVLASTLMFILTAVLLDALLEAMFRQPLLLLTAQVFGITSVLLLFASVVSTIAAMVAAERTSDAILLAGLGLYLCVHIPAMLLGSVPLITTAFTIFLTFALIAITAPGADRLGLPVDDSLPFFAVRLWPIITGAVAMGIAHASILADLQDQQLAPRTIVLVTIALLANLFALREAGGPKKPVVLPFSSRDRALQRLPKVLVNGEVRLLGQTVHRTADAKVVGIEATPAWLTDSDTAPSLEATAAAAGLETELDSVTLRLAQQHLPTVLSLIEADEPWLSVPLNGNTEAANQLPEHGGVDGLVLRVPSADVGNAVAPLRDHGAQLQVPTHGESDCEPEIVADHHQRANPSRRDTAPALLLGRVSLDSSKTEVNLVVDDSTPPLNLGTILRSVAAGEASTPIEIFEEEQRALRFGNF